MGRLPINIVNASESINILFREIMPSLEINFNMKIFFNLFLMINKFKYSIKTY